MYYEWQCIRYSRLFRSLDEKKHTFCNSYRVAKGSKLHLTVAVNVRPSW